MHSPVLAPANRPTIALPHTADVGMCCPDCMDTLTPGGACLNVGACQSADFTASKLARGETLKSRMSPAAWTISGGVD